MAVGELPGEGGVCGLVVEGGVDFGVMDEDDRAWVLERAAMMEFDGGMDRGLACRRAMACWEGRFLSVCGVGE